MRCYYCGFESDRQEVFCPYCGTRQEPVREEQSAGTVEALTQESEYDWQSYLAYASSESTDHFLEETPVIPAPQKAPVMAPAPQLMLPTGRGLAKMVFLGILTLGIYPLVIWSRIVTELNIAASRYDGERTMPYFAMTLLSPVTLGVYALVWFHDYCCRIGNELQRRDLEYRFGPKDFWLWNVLGSLILVGPFIFVHKLMKAMNLINKDFNING